MKKITTGRIVVLSDTAFQMMFLVWLAVGGPWLYSTYRADYSWVVFVPSPSISIPSLLMMFCIAVRRHWKFHARKARP